MDVTLTNAIRLRKLYDYFKNLQPKDITAETVITWIFVTEPVQPPFNQSMFKFIIPQKKRREEVFKGYAERIKTLNRDPLLHDVLLAFFDENDHHPIKLHLLDACVHKIPDMHTSVVLKQGCVDNRFELIHSNSHIAFLASELLPYLTSVDKEQVYHTRVDLIGKKNMTNLTKALKDMDDLRESLRVVTAPTRQSETAPTAPVASPVEDFKSADSEVGAHNPPSYQDEFLSQPDMFKSLETDQLPYYGANNKNSIYPELFDGLQSLPRAVAMNSVFRRLTPIFPPDDMVDVNTCDLVNFIRHHKFPSFSPVNMLNYETLSQAVNDINNIDEMESFDAMVGYYEREVLVEGWVVDYISRRSKIWQARTMNKVDPKVDLEKQLKVVGDNLAKLVEKVEDITGIDKLTTSINQIHEILISSGKASVRVLKPTIPEYLLNPIKSDENPGPSQVKGGQPTTTSFDMASRFLNPPKN